ncbi:MAG: hypothetical protein K1X31_10150 [Gemmatimonadaceae bacterium]|nr:hypothetical protein [Gemmatimonadaceae bacterium]
MHRPPAPSPRTLARLRAPAVGLALATLAALATACVPEPVRWDAPVTVAPGALDDTLRLALGDTGAPRLVPAWTPPAWPDEPGLCVATRRAARALADTAYASWFAVRPDSSVLLRVARSDDDGRTWHPAVSADTMDAGTDGCARPAPFIAADSLSGWLHLAYFLDAREGAGLFFTHTMERGTRFHEPVPIVYGDRPSLAAVASRGDTVVVVYEDPNSRLPRLGVAVSRTQGHLFEARQDATDATGESRAPRIAVRGTRLAIAWTSSQRGGAWPRTLVRTGTLAW